MAGKTENATKRRPGNWTLLVIAFLITTFCIGTGSYVQEQETIQVGAVAEKRYIAARDAVDEVITNRLKDAAADSVGPIYKNDLVAEENSRTLVNEMFQELNSILASLADGESYYERVQEASMKLPVVLSGRQLAAYESMGRAQRLLFAEDCIAAMNQVYSAGVTADMLSKGREQAQAAFAETEWSGELKEMASLIFSAALKPNLVPDEDAMEAAREAKRAEVENVMIRKNQKIVDEGEIITQEIYDRLQSLGLIHSADYQNSALPLLGSLLLVTLLFAGVVLYFLWGRSRKMLRGNERLMLFTIYTGMVILLRAMANIQNFTLIPLGLFAMLAGLLIGRNIALVINCAFCIVGCFIFNGDVEFLMYSLLVGTQGALLIQKTERRSHMVPAALAMGAVSFFSMLGVGLFFENGYSAELLLKSGFGALMGLVSVIIAVGSLPFWEAAFEANTPLRLLELTNPNNELLRRLMIEAPGTYHHSLIVANLAETAAYEIGANTALARAGAYYHDIGKLKDPRFFSENQTGYNPHDDLPPEDSARIIIQHAREGLEMGQAYGLPRTILDIIRQHHGTSLVKYFYFKALKAEGPEHIREEDFRYDGPVPSFRESAVVMLADTIEAAVRSMLGSGKTLAEAEEAVKGLMKDKLDDGQLNNSGLAIHELEIIRGAFLKVFHGMYHERVAYPKKEEIEAAAKKEPAGTEGETERDNMD